MSIISVVDQDGGDAINYAFGFQKGIHLKRVINVHHGTFHRGNTFLDLTHTRVHQIFDAFAGTAPFCPQFEYDGPAVRGSDPFFEFH
jgi:hypothetical protein